ncbi:hypothetical protein MIR68_000865, partial [Amoeboaphelidium protococcarum]
MQKGSTNQEQVDTKVVVYDRPHREVIQYIPIDRDCSSSSSSSGASQSFIMSMEHIQCFEWKQGEEEYIASMLRHVHDKQSQSQSQQLAQVDAIYNCLEAVAEIGCQQRCDLSEEQQNQYLSQ